MAREPAHHLHCSVDTYCSSFEAASQLILVLTQACMAGTRAVKPDVNDLAIFWAADQPVAQRRQIWGCTTLDDDLHSVNALEIVRMRVAIQLRINPSVPILNHFFGRTVACEREVNVGARSARAMKIARKRFRRPAEYFWLAGRGYLRVVFNRYQVVDEIANLWREERQLTEARVQIWGSVLDSLDRRLDKWPFCIYAMLVFPDEIGIRWRV